MDVNCLFCFVFVSLKPLHLIIHTLLFCINKLTLFCRTVGNNFCWFMGTTLGNNDRNQITHFAILTKFISHFYLNKVKERNNIFGHPGGPARVDGVMSILPNHYTHTGLDLRLDIFYMQIAMVHRWYVPQGMRQVAYCLLESSIQVCCIAGIWQVKNTVNKILLIHFFLSRSSFNSISLHWLIAALNTNACAVFKITVVHWLLNYIDVFVLF